MCDMTHSHVCHDSFLCEMVIRTELRIVNAKFPRNMNESWHTYEWVTAISLIHMCAMTHSYSSHNRKHKSCRPLFKWNVHSRFWFPSQWSFHMWMSHGSRIKESWLTYEWVMAHVWMSHGSCITHEWDMTHTWMSHGTHGSHMNESWHTCAWIMAQIYVRRIIHDWGAVHVALPRTATHCNTLQHTATHCNTLQHTATHCNMDCPSLRENDHSRVWCPFRL